jgi:hypothetical protein
MSKYTQSESSSEEIHEGKQRRRDELMRAVSQARAEDLEGPANRLREAMRKSAGEGRRQRLDPPSFMKES